MSETTFTVGPDDLLRPFRERMHPCPRMSETTFTVGPDDLLRPFRERMHPCPWCGARQWAAAVRGTRIVLTCEACGRRIEKDI